MRNVIGRISISARGNDNSGIARHEDHVGHKVVVENNWFVVTGSPQHGDKPNTAVITRTNIQEELWKPDGVVEFPGVGGAWTDPTSTPSSTRAEICAGRAT